MLKLICLFAPCLALQPAPGDSDTPTFSSRRVAVSYRTAVGAAAPSQVVLWTTTDGGDTWQKALSQRPTPALKRAGDDTRESVTFTAPTEGTYGFYLVLYNAAGASSEPPRRGTPPQQTVRIDDSAPIVTMLQARPDQDFDITRQVEIRWRVEDQSFAGRPVELYYRNEATRTFRPIAAAQPAAGRVQWIVPEDVVGRVEIKVAAADLAGHRAQQVVHDVWLSAAAAPAITKAATTAENQDAAPPSRDHLMTLIDDGPTPAAEADDVSPQARDLFDKATWHRARGELDLAVARYEDCLRLAPDLADARHDLAAVRLLQGDAQGAERLLRAILADEPKHLASLKTLALVLAKRGEYRTARETLQKVVLLAPQDAEAWLHSGDVAIFMGDRTAARDAWSRAASLVSRDDPIHKKARTRLEVYQQHQLAAERLDAP